jgi:hypothetical protein
MKSKPSACLRRVPAALTVAMLMLVLGGGATASAQVVTNTSDSGPGTLRYAITNATNDATITFDPSLSGATITLSNTLTINTNLTIDASALTGGIQINGNDSVGIFNVASNNTVVLNSLTIINGYVHNYGDEYSYASGIYNAGTLTVNECTLAGNSAVIGGGIYNGGTLTVNRSTITNGGGSVGGGIYNAGTLTVNECTLSGNNAFQNPAGGGVGGGGIFNYFGTLTVNQSTLSGNISPEGGSIFNDGGTLTITNSIVAGNSASPDADINGPFTCGGANIVQNYSGTITGPTPITNAPNLAAPGNYGGPTQTPAALARLARHCCGQRGRQYLCHRPARLSEHAERAD